METVKTIVMVLWISLFSTAIFAQFDKTACQEILSTYTKSNKEFAKMNVATLDFERHHQKFDIGWLEDFKFNFMAEVLDITYKTSAGTFHVYIPYAEILKINTSATAVDLIIKD
ncbi:hypothetical protein [Aureispira anguillae]|uniref:Uncharacterized protein n=1 Tax=Aureispira anguillae TaxID=2864201 RepID=A0A915YHG8_9BACT|nr:hypothetical protein [Aureispira anguillae]BDS13244.1 hypothetical protein AsAng_0039740 [Aureispira anguillae]